MARQSWKSTCLKPFNKSKPMGPQLHEAFGADVKSYQIQSSEEEPLLIKTEPLDLINKMDIKELLEFEKVAIDLAIEAGRMMLAASGRNKSIEKKASYVDLVTETDRAVEAFLFSELKRQFPGHKFIGEESTTSKIEWSDDPTWIIDPIDGTMNFIHTFPFVCVSIGLTIAKDIVFGLIYSPFLDKLYTAKKGYGAYCNGVRINVRDCETIKDALLICELGSNRDDEVGKALFKNLQTVGWACHGTRSLGSAALNSCMVASGYANAYWEFGLHCWDMAGGAIIVREAGGYVCDTEGGPFDLMSRRWIAACSEKLAKELASSLPCHLKLQRD